jgi:hypothetical protein
MIDLAPIKKEAESLAVTSAEAGTRNLARLILKLCDELEKAASANSDTTI